MARKIGTSYDFLKKYEIQNAKIHVLASDPAGLVSGDAGLAWYNSTSGMLKVWNGTAAVLVATDAMLLGGHNSAYHLDRTNQTNTQVAATISDLNTAVRAGNRIDQLAAAGADVNFGGFKATNLADGTAGSDGATYGQLLAMINNQVFKAAARVATTAAITLSGTQTIDTVALSAGDRVLVKDQASGPTNGLYVVAAGAWSRATDADSASEMAPGSIFTVNEGAVNGDKLFMLTTNGPITLGTTALTFSAYGAASGEIGVAGAGLTKTGVTYDVGAGNGITVNADSIQLDAAVALRKVQGVIPATTGGLFVVSGVQVTWNHGLANPAARPTINYYTSPGSGNTQGDPIELDYNNPDGNNTVLQFPAAPAANQFYGMIEG